MTRAASNPTGHPEQHPLSGATVILRNVAQDPRGMILNGAPFRIEDWVDRLGQSWKEQENWATLHYAARQRLSTISNRELPDDEEVVYGKIGALGNCVHASELGGIE